MAPKPDRNESSEIGDEDLTTSNLGRVGIDDDDDDDGDGSEHFITEESKREDLVIAKAESRAVMGSKVCVYVLLTLCALATSIYTWFFVRREEFGDFKDEFHQFADSILAGADSKTLAIFRQMETLSTALTSHALDSGEEWPFTTLPHFYTRSQELQDLAGSSLIIFAPLVENRTSFEAFTIAKRSIIEKDTFAPNVLNQVKSMDQSPVIFPVPPEYRVSDTDYTDAIALPTLQYGPSAVSNKFVNMDLYTLQAARQALDDARSSGRAVLSNVADVSLLVANDDDSPLSLIVEPVMDNVRAPASVVGFVLAIEPWTAYLEDNLPAGVEGFVVYIVGSCGEELTFRLNGGNVVFAGEGDLHDSRYDDISRTAEFASFTGAQATDDDGFHCSFSMTVYPSRTFEKTHYSSESFIYAALVLGVFSATILAFLLYDLMVERRQEKVLTKAQQTTEIVRSLFPKKVGNRLIAEAERKVEKPKKKSRRLPMRKPLLEQVDQEDSTSAMCITATEPIADHYPECSILFADMAGFTAWSSTREPRQVFLLLETVFREFDAKAKQRRVFKVETVGDCYVAVAGVPEPNPKHAVAMARFASDCVRMFGLLMRQLEPILGPETTDLQLRAGIHSGSVTGGVLRSDRARFQLFGDTMNTASRMESTGQPSKVQISLDTAELLRNAGKGQWFREREEGVFAKGKGKMQTFWLELESHEESNTSETSDSDPEPLSLRRMSIGPSKPLDGLDDDKVQRLVSWNADILERLLHKVISHRSTPQPLGETSADPMRELEQEILHKSSTPFDELEETIDFDSSRFFPPVSSPDQTSVVVDELVSEQLSDYIHAIASMYRKNDFHNFEHASHVTMSLMKIVSRINRSTYGSSEPHGTLDLMENPLVHFTIVLASLIHDVDHPGITNAQLNAEGSRSSTMYKHQSVAEQNSFDLGWKLLMGSEYKELRRAIYATESELKFFRQLLLHAVLATDVIDTKLVKQRNDRWNAAFSETPEESSQAHVLSLRKTVLVETLMQVADIAHTMQAWQIYVKWNERLFREVHWAFKANRAEQNPSENWYETEKVFFDLCVIPLAMKLESCGILGATGNELVRHAKRNRKEWELLGPGILTHFKEVVGDVDFEKEEKSSD